MTEKKARSMAGLPWIAAMAFFMQALDATILNTALPAIAQSLDRSPLAMQSAIISYTLTVAMLIPASGWLADRLAPGVSSCWPSPSLRWVHWPAHSRRRSGRWSAFA
jgi:MFS family permease